MRTPPAGQLRPSGMTLKEPFMRKSSGLLALVALIASVVGGNWLYAQQRRAGHVLLSAEDYMEIQQLYGFYARDVDPGSKRNAAWMFTEDAVAQMGTRRYTGQELKDFYAQVPRNQSA